MQGRSSGRSSSAWKLNSEDGFFTAALREAELALAPTVLSKDAIEPEILLDPPVQIDSSVTQELILATEDERLEEESGLRPEEYGFCKMGPSTERASRSRPTPSLRNTKQLVSTVEVVKHNGMYSIVIDGVSQGSVSRTTSGQYKKKYAYWLPRFKEKLVDEGTERARRVVQPMLFSMRAEDYESMPASCKVHVRQRVVNNASVYMDEEEIKSFEVKPYRSSDTFTTVTTLPYPTISTPAPYVTLNDYSKVMDIELSLKLHYLPDSEKEKLQENYAIVVQANEKSIEPGSDSWMAIKLLRDVIGGVVSATTFTARVLAQTAVTTTTSSTTSKVLAGGAASAAGLPAVAGGAALLAAVHLVWNSIARRKAQITLSDKEVVAYQAALASALSRGPDVHRIELSELTAMIYRIAETRANGSLVSKTEQTVGYSIHDLADEDWNKEAALLAWLTYGSGDREGRDAYTGIYSDASNTTHATQFSSKASAQNAKVTLNTIGVQGMDCLTLSNTRTEFTYVIRIVEQDGTDGPTFVLNPTRINGIDAALIASGYNERLLECKKATMCLRERLASLPGVSRFMATSGTFVSDTNNGVMLAQGPSDVARLLVGRDLEDGFGVKTDKESLEKRAQKAEKELESINNNIQKLIDAIKKKESAIKKAKDPAVKVRNRDQKKELEDRLALLQQESVQKKTRVERAKLTAENPRRFANIFDYEATHKRLMQEVLGASVDNSEISQDSIDTEPLTFWAAEYPQPDSVEEATLEKHISNSRFSLCKSLGIPPEMIGSEDARLVRFIEILCPISTPRNPKFMRFYAHVVPRSLECDYDECSQTPEAIRIMPQIMTFTKELTSTFGNVTIIQPANVSDVTFINKKDSSLASKSVNEARKALRNMTGEFPTLLETMNVTDEHGLHFVQSYDVHSPLVAKEVFKKPVNAGELGTDMIAMSYLPNVQTITESTLFDINGGSVLKQIMHMSAGTKVYGSAALLSEFGLPRDLFSVLAMAAFSEIVASYVVNHAVSNTSNNFELERQELVQSVFSNAQFASLSIGVFLTSMKSSKSSPDTVLKQNDASFFCIPGLLHLRTSLRRIGAFQAGRASFTQESCYKTGSALSKLGSLTRIEYNKLPFSCIQSCLASLPAAVKALTPGISSIEAHVKACALSYERIFYGALACTASRTLVVYACADCVYSRPVVLKALKARIQEAILAASSASNLEAQRHWMPKPLLDNMEMRAFRMARMRLDIHEEQKASPAISNDNEYEPSIKVLAQELNMLDIRDISSIDTSRPVSNYYIPFGLVGGGSTRDLMYSKFETHPVWIRELEIAASSVLVQNESDALFQATCKTTIDGKLQGPNVIKVYENSVNVRLYPTVKVNRALEDTQSLDMFTESFNAFCSNASPDTSKMAGTLSENYRLCMHNSERIFQLAVAASSGALIPGINYYFKTRLNPPENTHMPSFLACVCVGNALAAVETQSTHSVVLLDGDNTLKEVSAKIATMCRMFNERGVKAMPFNELCACVSLL